MDLVAKAIEISQNENTFGKEFFINYSGHVNQLSISYYECGWSETTLMSEKWNGYLTDEDTIQEAYWFLANRVK